MDVGRFGIRNATMKHSTNLNLLMWLRECIGIAKSGFWWFITYSDGQPTYCLIMKARMICDFCPHHVSTEDARFVKMFCDIAHEKKWGC